MNIFVQKNGEQLGPFNLEEIRSQISSKTLKPTDWAWYEGLQNWVRLADVPGFQRQQRRPPSPRRTINSRPETSELEKRRQRSSSRGSELHIRYGHRRPALVWIFSLYYFIKTPINLLILVLVPLMATGSVPLDENQRHYYESQHAITYLLGSLPLFLNFFGAFLLFFLRRSSLYCFFTSFVLVLANYTYQILYLNWLGTMGSGASLLPVVFGLGINLCALLYVWRLFSARILI